MRRFHGDLAPPHNHVLRQTLTVKRTSEAAVIVQLADARVEIGSGADRVMVSMVLESLRSASAGGRA